MGGVPLDKSCRFLHGSNKGRIGSHREGYALWDGKGIHFPIYPGILRPINPPAPGLQASAPEAPGAPGFRAKKGSLSAPSSLPPEQNPPGCFQAPAPRGQIPRRDLHPETPGNTESFRPLHLPLGNHLPSWPHQPTFAWSLPSRSASPDFGAAEAAAFAFAARSAATAAATDFSAATALHS